MCKQMVCLCSSKILFTEIKWYASSCSRTAFVGAEVPPASWYASPFRPWPAPWTWLPRVTRSEWSPGAGITVRVYSWVITLPCEGTIRICWGRACSHLPFQKPLMAPIDHLRRSRSRSLTSGATRVGFHPPSQVPGPLGFTWNLRCAHPPHISGAFPLQLCRAPLPGTPFCSPLHVSVFSYFQVKSSST